METKAHDACGYINFLIEELQAQPAYTFKTLQDFANQVQAIMQEMGVRSIPMPR